MLGSVVRMGQQQQIPVPTVQAMFSALIVRERQARSEMHVPIYPLTEGQKILGAICNFRGQQIPAEFSRAQKKAEEYRRPEWYICPMSSAVASGGQVPIPNPNPKP